MLGACYNDIAGREKMVHFLLSYILFSWKDTLQ